MTYHVLLCPCMEWMLVWEEAIDGLEAWMVEVEMDPDIQYCICTTLQTRDPSHLFMAYTRDGLQVVAQEQDAIGWMNLLEGRISTKWHQ